MIMGFFSSDETLDAAVSKLHRDGEHHSVVIVRLPLDQLKYGGWWEYL